MITIGDLKRAIAEIEESYNFGPGFGNISIDDIQVLIHITKNSSSEPETYTCDSISHDLYECPNNEVRVCISLNSYY